MYGSAFCRVYNEFGWNVYPEVFAGRLIKWLSARDVSPRRALDLGCGTGVLCRVLAENGVEAEGVDLSAGMIALARENAPGLRFAVDDMVTYRPAAPCDLVTCTGDALNHLFDLGDVRRLVENVASYLSPGGYFVFDLLGEREVPGDEPFALDYSQKVRAVFHTTRRGDEVRLHIEVFENGARVLEEDILEKIHDVDTVTALLRAAGLTVVHCSHRLLPDDPQDAAAWFIAAKKDSEE